MSSADEAASSATGVGERHGKYRLAKTVGVFAIMASAVAQEYGAGINTVLTKSVGAHPELGMLIPVAMFAAGILLLPKIAMLGRFAQVMPRAGSAYVWLTRSTHPSVGFAVAFLWFIGVTAAMGFLAFSFTTFIAGVLAQFGLSVAWLSSHAGHLIIGFALLLLIFFVHVSGVRNYGFFVSLLFALVLFAALLTIIFGFAGSPHEFVGKVSGELGHPVQATVPGQPTVGAFVATVTLFMFAYGGQAAATSLGGEARDATRTVGRGVWYAWGVAIVLYTVVSFALFHAAPLGAVQALLDGGRPELATTPGVIALIAPRAIGVIISVTVILIIGKTVAPEMLDSSRYLFAWAQDRLLPKAFLHTNRNHAPDVALLASTVLGGLFLVEVTFFGFQIGVLLRSMSIVLVIGVLGVGVLNMRLNPRFAELGWARTLTAHKDALVAACFGIVIAGILLYSVIVVPGEPLILQPSVQALIGLAVAVCIYVAARAVARRQGHDLAAHIKEAPLE
ncbi:MAG: APC family permease [Streptosporangiales bacterium]